MQRTGPIHAIAPLRRRGAAIALVLLAVLACTRRPGEDAFDNPFDPAGTGGDPFRVEATATSAGIVVRWRAAPVPGVENYEVLRGDAAAGPFAAIDEVAPSASAVLTYRDTSYARNRTNYYKVRAQRGTERSLDSRVVAASTFAPPQVLLPDDTLFARRARVRVRADAGDAVEVALAADFTGAVVLPRTSAVVATELELAPAESALAIATVHARVRTAGVAGAGVTASAVVGFEAAVAFRDTAVVDTIVVVHARGRGIAAARAATSRAALALAPWSPNPDPGAGVDTLVCNVRVPALVAPFRVYVESRADFGFVVVDSLAAVPRRVGPASLVIDDGRAVTASRTVTLDATAPWATEMRVSESADLSGVPWLPFAARSSFTLGPGLGPKTVYAVFRNGLDPTGQAAAGTIERIGEP